MMFPVWEAGIPRGVDSSMPSFTMGSSQVRTASTEEEAASARAAAAATAGLRSCASAASWSTNSGVMTADPAGAGSAAERGKTFKREANSVRRRELFFIEARHDRSYYP